MAHNPPEIGLEGHNAIIHAIIARVWCRCRVKSKFCQLFWHSSSLLLRYVNDYCS